MLAIFEKVKRIQYPKNAVVASGSCCQSMVLESVQ